MCLVSGGLLQPQLECTRVIYHSEVCESRGKKKSNSSWKRKRTTEIYVKHLTKRTKEKQGQRIWFVTNKRELNGNLTPLLATACKKNPGCKSPQAVLNSSSEKVLTSASLDSSNNSVCLSQKDLLLRACADTPVMYSQALEQKDSLQSWVMEQEHWPRAGNATNSWWLSNGSSSKSYLFNRVGLRLVQVAALLDSAHSDRPVCLLSSLFIWSFDSVLSFLSNNSRATPSSSCTDLCWAQQVVLSWEQIN